MVIKVSYTGVNPQCAVKSRVGTIMTCAGAGLFPSGVFSLLGISTAPFKCIYHQRYKNCFPPASMEHKACFGPHNP